MEISDRQAMNVLQPQATGRLRASLQGNLLLPGDPGYDAARMVYNGMIDRYPALVVQCAGTGDVVQAIRFAREQALPVAVRGGGHGLPGYATVDHGLVIDLSYMKDILIDAERQTVLASGGVNLGELLQAAQSYGLVLPVGTDADTGLAGLTLGGGAGSLTGIFGLTCDNALWFEMVTAEGEVVHASPIENPDLFWGLRGGSGNFGVVTKFEFQLHPVSNVLGGVLTFPQSRAREVLRVYDDFIQEEPDELTVLCSLLTSPDGHPVIGLVVCYCGDLQAGEKVIAPLRKLGPIADLVQPMPYTGLLGLIPMPRGRRYYGKGGTLLRMTDEVNERLAAAAAAHTSPYSVIVIEHIHGAAARVAADATAFPVRQNAYLPFIMAQWETTPDQPHIDWTRSTYAALQPYFASEEYVNFIGNDGDNRVAASYGANYARLVALKRRYDPQNFFRLNSNIAPG